MNLPRLSSLVKSRKAAGSCTIPPTQPCAPLPHLVHSHENGHGPSRSRVESPAWGPRGLVMMQLGSKLTTDYYSNQSIQYSCADSKYESRGPPAVERPLLTLLQPIYMRTKNLELSTPSRTRKHKFSALFSYINIFKSIFMASALFLQASPTALACILVLLSLLDFIAVTLRLYCRRSLKQPLRPDDWLVILGFLLSSGRLPVFIYSIARHATGYPTDSPDEFGIKYDAQATNIEKALYAITILTIASLWAVKLSFLFFYRRIFIIDERNYKDAVNIAAIVLIFLTTAWAIGFIVPEIFACRPISGFWESEVAKCINTWEWNQGEFIVDAVLDIAIIAFPIPLVWKMKLRRRQKVGVLAVFMIGALAIASSIWATFINFWMTYYSQDHDVDPNLMFSNIIFWNMIEPTLAILAACGPQLKGLVRTPAYVALKKYLLFVTRVELKETED